MIRLSRYPTREKDDVLSWDEMPAGSCDMNFRPPAAVSPDGLPTVWFLFVSSIASAVAFAVSILLAKFLPIIFVDLELLVWIAIAISIPLLMNLAVPQQESGLMLYGTFVFLILVACIANSLSPNNKTILYVFCLLAVIIPQIFRLADALGSHYVEWVTASPQIDLRTLTLVRRAWAARFKGKGLAPAMLFNRGLAGNRQSITTFLQICRLYPTLYFVVVVTIVVGVIAAFLVASSRSLSVSVVVALSLLLVGLAFVINRSFRGTFSIVTGAIRHFVEYEMKVSPPWIFQSPVGSAIHRQSLLFVSILLLSFFVNGCWFATGVDGVFDTSSLTRLLLGLAFQVTVTVFLAPVLLFSIVTLAVGPILWVHHQACEGNRAWLARSGWTEFDIYNDRLRNSSNPVERNSIWIGFHKILGFPILVAINLLREHVHILGATGSGKTGLGLTTMIGQLIRRGDGPVIVLDCKGDRALLHSVRIWTEQAGRRFKWFTTTHNKSTYIFNPFDQNYLNCMTIQELVGLFLVSFNLHHGDDYGRAWFGAACKAAFMASVKQTKARRPFSFREFQREVEIIMNDHDEFKSAFHLMFVMQSLAQFDQLNLSPTTNDHPACRHAIHLPEAIENKQVIYFNLESLTDPMSAGEISRLVAYSAISAASDYQARTGRPANVTLVIDEAQNVIAKNISNVLAQARTHGLTCILAHQTRSQLNPPGGVDLREVVESCTCVKQFFTARDPDSRKYLSSISGEVGYYTAQWQQFAFRINQGDVGLHRAVHYGDEPAIANVSESVGPRLADDDISEINHNTNQCAIAIERYEGFSRFRGAFPIHIDYPISKDDYDRRSSKMRWPTASGETIDVDGFWPEPNEETVLAKRKNMDVDSALQALTLENLDELNRKLNLDGDSL